MAGAEVILCKDCFSPLLPIDETKFVCKECDVLLYKGETIHPQASQDIAGVLRLCQWPGGRQIKEAVIDAIKEIAKNRNVLEETIRDSCTRRIGLTGSGAFDRFVEKVRLYSED